MRYRWEVVIWLETEGEDESEGMANIDDALRTGEYDQVYTELIEEIEDEG